MRILLRSLLGMVVGLSLFGALYTPAGAQNAKTLPSGTPGQNKQTRSTGKTHAKDGKGASSNKAPAPPNKIESFAAVENKNSMRITLKASRDQTTAGSSFGITAEIENISSQPIYIMASALAMTVPPELDAHEPHDLWAFIPGVQAVQGDYWNTVIVLEPGSVISAFWSGGSVAQQTGTVTESGGALEYARHGYSNFLQGLGFSPGRYTLTVVASYWDTYEGARNRSVEHHTQTSAIQETINAPQSVILFGAALGGIIAFLLLTKLQPTSTSGWASVPWIPGLLSAVLLSSIVTILIARLSQSQFIISVTVNDFWGAIAVGFIITATGPSILRKFSGFLNAPSAAVVSASGAKSS